MAKRKRAKDKRAKDERPERAETQAPHATAKKPVPFDPQQAKQPLLYARVLGVLIVLCGAAMLVLGVGILTGRISDGWGFPMSAVPNWGRPWGAVLALAGLAYLACPVLLFVRPRKGVVAMLILCGLNVLIGTPLITTTTEILFNLSRDEKFRPDWVDSVWGYFMLINIGVIIAIYRALSSDQRQTETAPAS